MTADAGKHYDAGKLNEDGETWDDAGSYSSLAAAEAGIADFGDGEYGIGELGGGRYEHQYTVVEGQVRFVDPC